MERLAPLNSKDDKVSYIHNHLDDDCCHIWVLERLENEKLFIKIIPFHDTWFNRKYESDSNLIRHIILTPII